MLGSDETVLVIGGGAGGHACVTTYREAGGRAPVLLVSADDRLPYFRPHVSKEHLAGDVERSADLAEPSWYGEHDVEVVLDCRVTSLDLGGHLAATSAGPLRWGRCVLATGSAAAPLPVPGGDDPDLLTIRQAADGERLLRRLEHGGAVAVVGSGFVGCEVAASLRRHGIDVTMVSDEAEPQHDRLGAAVGRMIAGWLVDAGVRLLGGRAVQRIDRRADGFDLVLPDTTVTVQHVVVAVGARPNTELARRAGLDGDVGVPVGATMHTAAGDLFAVGDIAHAHNEAASRPLRVEHWGDAEGQGRIAGAALAGEAEPWRDVPGFWSVIAGQTMKYVAWGDGHDEVRVRSSSHGTTVWYGREGRAVGVLTHDHDEDHEAAAAMVTAGAELPPSS